MIIALLELCAIVIMNIRLLCSTAFTGATQVTNSKVTGVTLVTKVTEIAKVTKLVSIPKLLLDLHASTNNTR